MPTPTPRGAMAGVTSRVRAYFAPVQRTTSTLVAFDLARDGAAACSAPPAGFFDAGWIANFARMNATTIQTLRAGRNDAVAAQVRDQLEARVAFEFGEWGKLQMAIAGGSEHFNLLRPDLVTDPSGVTPFAACALLTGSTASELKLASGDLAKFAAGDLVVADVDYAAQTGYVGSGITGAYVATASEVGSDANFIRRVSFNVARVASVTSTSLRLAQPLLGGAPSTGAKVQPVVGFADRDGGRFLQEWSAIFVVADGGTRVLFYYPRLQTSAAATEGRVALAEPLAAATLRAEMRAFPITDARDGQQVLSYRALFPAASAPVR